MPHSVHDKGKGCQHSQDLLTLQEFMLTSQLMTCRTRVKLEFFRPPCGPSK